MDTKINTAELEKELREELRTRAEITWDNVPEYAEMYPTLRDAYIKGAICGGIWVFYKLTEKYSKN